jgi:hypothetical protein
MLLLVVKWQAADVVGKGRKRIIENGRTPANIVVVCSQGHLTSIL